MKKTLKYIDGTSDKFWQVEAQGIQLTVTYGKNSTSGASQTKLYNTAEECLKIAEKLVAEKLKKGYSETGEVAVEASSKTGKAKSAMQEITAEYDQIVIEKRFDKLLPFLQETIKGNVTEFKKYLKKAKKYWCDYVDLHNEPQFLEKKSNYSWGRRGDVEQMKMISLTALAIMDKTEINAFDGIISYLEDIKKDPIVKDLVFWAKPNWLAEYLLNLIKKNEWATIDYFILRYLEDEKLLEYNPELFALNLSKNYEYRTKDTTRNYIKKITQDPIAIKRDVPLLFEYQTTLNNLYFRDNDSQKYNEFKTWSVAFNQFLNDGLLDRAFFIENCLLIQTKEWNNGIKGFFKNVLIENNPTAEELIKNQDIIFTFLQNAYPPIITLGVDLIKQLFEHKKFKTNDFLEWVSPVFYREDAKGSLKKLLPIFEKIAQNNPKQSPKMALMICDLFVVPDLSLQERAVKTIEKIASKKDTEFKEKLSLYTPQMQGNVKNLLADFLVENSLEETDFADEKYEYEPQKNAPKLLNEVQLPTDWNGVLFQFGHFLKNYGVIDSEILLNAFITQQNLFPADFLKELKPYFKQLEKTYFESEAKNYIKSFLMAKMIHWNQPAKVERNKYNKIKTYDVFYEVLKKVDEKMRTKSSLPLLCFPTHLPHWVAPKTLLERIIAYQNANETIDLIDLSIAICRMPRENIAEALPLLPQIDAELRDLLEFCFGLHKEIKITKESVLNKLFHAAGNETVFSKNLGLWAVAARTHYPDETFDDFPKSPYTDAPFVKAPFHTTIGFETKVNEWVDYQTKEKMRYEWVEIKVDMPEFKALPKHFLYSSDTYFFGNPSYYNQLDYKDNVFYWNSLTPQNNDALALHLLTTSCVNLSEGKDDVKAYLEIMSHEGYAFGFYDLAVFAAAFFMDKKDIRLMASEILYQKITQKSIDVAHLGRIIASYISNGYGIFSRFLESILTLKDNSNSALLLLMEAVLGHLDLKEKLPTNFKKFIENYYDLLTKLNAKPSEKTKLFLENYKDNGSLKKLIKEILN